ncbi:MAG TPA: aldo/keto reductase, partial [Fimbriimonas sp.]
VRAIHAALDGGVNYLDTAPSYTGTRSEQAIGEVMRTRRKEVFLATKTLARDADGAYAEVRQSLERLKTDRVDLIQVHAVNDFATLDQILTGTVKGLEKAKREGWVRFIGITGHTRPEVILKAIRDYPFASVLIPVSALDAHLNDFAKDVVPEARRLGIGITGMKSLKGIEIAKGSFSPEPFLRYAMSLPISTLAVGFRKESEVPENLRVARGFRPMDAGERRALEDSVKESATSANLWWKRT